MRQTKRPRRGECPTGKIGYADAAAAKVEAVKLARVLRKEGVIAESIYSYQCRACKRLHFTRMSASRGGAPNRLVYLPAPVEMQLWSMTVKARDRAERSLADTHEP